MKKILSFLFILMFVCSVSYATVTDQTQRVQYTATADQTVFAYTWRILDEDDLDVLVDGVITTAYSASNVGVLTGGNVTFNTGRTAGEIITIIRNMPLSQDTDYPAGGRLSTVNLEKNLDELMMISQDLKEQIGRAPKTPGTSTVKDTTFPVGTSASNRANKGVIWNSLGTDLTLVSLTTSDGATAITTEGDIAQGGTGGVVERLGIGNTGDLLTVTSGKLAYERSRNIAWNKGSDIANTTSIAIPDVDANYFDLTATNTIDSISSTNLDVGAMVRFHFDVAATLTHHNENLVLPNGADISVSAGDEVTFIQYATDDYRLVARTSPPDSVPINMADEVLRRPTIHDYAEVLNTVPASGSNLTLSLEDGNVHNVTLDTACILSFADPPATSTAGSFTLFLRQNGTGGNATTFPASVNWASATAPTLTTTADALDILVFITLDNGENWHGMISSTDSRQ